MNAGHPDSAKEQSDLKRNSAVSISIKDKQALYMAYMPFLKNGGMFIPTKKSHKLGEKMYLLVTIMDEAEPLQISGKIVWINPPGALGNRPQGVGLQFQGETAKAAVNMIESKLGGSITLTHGTHTM